ncbi:hypothetical protein O0L34_g8102 [Tuta absoluta]|nr:hypothetical protein O0L34_g8102 [Tuta absoluta]
MYRTKKDVDKHVENLISKLSVKEFKTRAYSVARLYYEVGDYSSCQRYVEQYLSQKDNNAAAHKLLGQALQKLGQKEKALEQYKTSLDIDPTQTSTILEICELLADDDVVIDPGRAKYWCEKAEATFPRHPVTFRLRERLVTMANPDPEALVKLLIAELSVKPKDAVLHCRLLKHYLSTNQINDAFEHGCKIEFGSHTFSNSFAWYETLAVIVKHNGLNTNDWLYQLLLLTARERICVLSLTETPSGTSKSLIECGELLHTYDQAIEKVATVGTPPGFGEFHAALLQHHRGQFAFHAATYLLKKAKKDQLSWRDAMRTAAPLMLMAWQTVPLDSKVNWLTHAPDKQQAAVHRWYTEGSYRCSQAGHYLLANIQDKSQAFLDRISQNCTGAHWRDKLYEKIFTNRDHLAKIKTSHFASDAFSTPILRLPRRTEVEAYDVDAQREYPNSLHQFVWMLLNYKNYAHFKCTIFDMLSPNAANSGLETLNKLDVHAFLYFAALTSRQQKTHEVSYVGTEKPSVLPAVITDLLCPLSQMKWWDCAYKFSQNELGTEFTDIRATLSRGIEVVRCIDNHGLDPELLCQVAKIFGEMAKLTTVADEKRKLEARAGQYYSSALPLLEKLKSKIVIKMPEKRLFDYTHKELGTKELNSLIEESKLYVAVNCLNDGDYDKAIDLLTNLKSPEACYHLSQAYKKLALEESNASRDNTSKYATLILKAKSLAYKALERVKDTEMNKAHPLYTEIQQLIEDIETHINRNDLDLSVNNHDNDGKYSSDENISSAGSEHVPMRNNNHMLRNLSSTPKQQPQSQSMLTNYRSCMDSQLHDTTRVEPQFFEKIENQIKTFQKRLADDFMEQTKSWFEENRKLGNQIMTTLQTDIQNTTDQFKLLKLSVDHVKDQLDECRNECKDVGDLKKQISELKKEVNKLKKSSLEQAIDESDLYNLDDEYRTSEPASSFSAQLPFQNPQVMQQFNQRIVPPFPMPPNPYQVYSQSLYNLYNQYSQFTQNPTLPGAPPLFDPAKLSYPGMYPTPDQMYLDMAHIVPPTVPPPAPTVPTVPAVPTMPPVPTMSTVPTASIPSTASATATAKPAPKVDAKEISRSLPVNVVITSSDPLPTSSAPAPVLSVTIPPKHIKGTPHNYQIALPTSNETNTVSAPVFSFPTSGNTPTSSTPRGVVHWNGSMFKPQPPTSGVTSETSIFNTSNISDSFDRSVVDGSFTGNSPNTSVNKSRTLSERSNTSVEYDPCPDFKPIIPLPDEVKVTTGEEDEIPIFSARSKLFRFIDKQWKERGIGEMKLLKHKVTGKVRVLMRREQIHKICANHIITPEMEILPMKNENKAYFWVANDFADEMVVLEKFCIRFKTAEIAHQFFTMFEKARQEASKGSAAVDAKVSTSTSATDIIKNKASEDTKKNEIKTTEKNPPVKVTTGFSLSSGQNKTQFGGFTFSSTPAFKPLEEVAKTDTKAATVAEPATTKVNVFSNLSFNKTTASSPFSNLFGATSSPITNTISAVISSSSPSQKLETPDKLNTSDVMEEFEPNVDFKPVIPLPALVDQKTGEEDENILFEHRAKLLRFDVSSKEWKERGLGNIKLLVQKDNAQKVRLLMRREQIMKICCNHAVTKDMTFQRMPNMDKAVTWCAKDFSEGELVAETFCLRFKTVQTCNEFMEALKSAQSKLKDDSKAAKEEQNAAKQSNQTGFGDKFKPKSGSWYCEACYTNNLESFTKCACCEQPKPNSGAEETKTSTAAPSTNRTLSWGDKFKPKAGSWECDACLVRNEASVDYCSACDNPKDPSMPKKDEKPAAVGFSKFNFGIPQQAETVQNKEFSPAPAAATATTGWGDMSAGPKFKFGIPEQTDVEKPKSEPAASMFDGSGAHKFKFGIPADTSEKPASVLAFGDQKTTMFGVAKAPSGSDIPLNLVGNKNEVQNQQSTPVKPALLPTPKNEGTPFGAKETHNTFDFVFKPKTPPKGKSPLKSPKADGNESDENEYASEDEGHHIHFNPIIPLPDKVEVVTGEENETELYGHRAKLFRFMGGEWKERGLGVVKVLKHKETGKLRIVMRRDQIFKICLNHALTSDIVYTPKDEKTWLFAANDFSEGELSLQQFCLRFKTKEIALDFKDAVDKAREGKPIVKRETGTSQKDNDSDDVVFVGETFATAEEKERAKELMLPENFYTYKSKDPCKGCRGCTEESDGKTESSSSAALSKTSAPFKLSVASSGLSTPGRTTAATFQSPMTSFYGTPSNFDKTSDTSIFRTPLGSIGSNTNSASPGTPLNSGTEKDATNKENTFAQKNIFGGATSNIFGTPQGKAGIFSGSDSQSTTASKSAILAAPKLSTLNTSEGEKPSSDAKSIFASAQAKPVLSENKSIFGTGNTSVSSTKSIFGVVSDTKDEEAKPEVKSIFGGDGQKSGNLFGGTGQGLFGAGANNQQKPLFGSGNSIFGSNTTSSSVFGSGSVFGSAANQPQWGIAKVAEEKKPDVTPNPSQEENKGVKKENEEVKETPFKVDNSLSFAALSSGSETTFVAQKKPDFQWEGAGQQLFTSAQKAARDADKSKNESGADDSGAGADEEYDPHYEPIVPLPDKIVVTTGEEDEEKMFGERCKLYRYDDKTREWKERGVGEMKILYHPERNTYRLLLRREQVHKAVLNMLIFMDMELLPMKNSDCAWTWAGTNFAENPQGEQETLAVRFKSVDLAANFKDKVVECTRKLQVAAAKAIKEEKESDKPASVAPLRLPKHLESSARADTDFSFKVPFSEAQSQQTSQLKVTLGQVIEGQIALAQAQAQDASNGVVNRTAEVFKQVHFQEPEGEHCEEDEEVEDYEHDYNPEDYEAYYNEEEENAIFESDAAALIEQGSLKQACGNSHVEVMFDHEVCMPKIVVTDNDTGEILADMLIHTDTQFQMEGNSCKWSGKDFSNYEPVDKSVSVTFPDSDSAMQFYDSCETSKGATYASNEPES